MSTDYDRQQRAATGLSQLSTNDLRVLTTVIRPQNYPQDYVYNGKSLSEWLHELDENVDENTREAARKTIKQLGTNAIPPLIALLSIPISELEELLIRQAGLPLERASFRRYAVVDGFKVLGGSAAPAIPALAKLLGDWDVGFYAADALSAIGHNSMPVLLQTLTDPNPIARKRSAQALGSFSEDSEKGGA
jgi:HEAT repeat protein